MKAFALLALIAVACAARLPEGFVEPEYVDKVRERARLRPTRHGKRALMGLCSQASLLEIRAKPAAAAAAAAPAGSPPGPWFGSYSGRMDPLGYNVPPCALNALPSRPRALR
jgi:hypothetical protein